MIYLLFSADYELFFGRNFVPEQEVLIEPTRDLLRCCKDIALPVTLFADVLCAIKYRQVGRMDFVEDFQNQLLEAVELGNDVQAHTHPHWLTAETQGNQWWAEGDRFLFGTYPVEDRYAFALQVIIRVKQYLEKILRQAKPDYECLAFRAGGYGLQPQDCLVFAAMREAGILVDSSVVPGLVMRTSHHQVDFSAVPAMANWYISPEKGLNLAAGDGVFEIPILGYQESCKDAAVRVLEKISGRAPTQNYRKCNPLERGLPIVTATRDDCPDPDPGRAGWFADKLKRFVSPRFYELELTVRLAEMTKATELYLSRHYRPGTDLYVSMICHPKALHEPELETLAEYMECLRSRWRDELVPITFLEAARRLQTRHAPLAAA